jgi:hypothetical protein
MELVMPRLTADMVVVMVGASAAATAGELTGMSQHLVITLWCIAGGCLGALCSLHFFRVVAKPLLHLQGETTRQYARRKAAAERELAWDIVWQFVINLILSAAASPLLVPTVASWTGFPEGMNTAIVTSLCIGTVAQQIVTNWVIPLGRRWLQAKATKLESDLGIKPAEVRE